MREELNSPNIRIDKKGKGNRWIKKCEIENEEREKKEAGR